MTYGFQDDITLNICIGIYIFEVILWSSWNMALIILTKVVSTLLVYSMPSHKFYLSISQLLLAFPLCIQDVVTLNICIGIYYGFEVILWNRFYGFYGILIISNIKGKESYKVYLILLDIFLAYGIDQSPMNFLCIIHLSVFMWCNYSLNRTSHVF